MKIILTTAVIALAVASPSALADDPMTVFGIQFNSKLSIAECNWSLEEKPRYRRDQPKEKVAKYAIDRPKNDPCYKRPEKNIGPSLPLTDEALYIVFPIGKEPSLSKRGDLTIRLVDSRVQRISFITSGISLQESILQSLTEKFGSPTKIDRSKVQNRMGAQFEAIDAIWNISGTTVTYISALGTIDQGEVIISTPQGEQSYRNAVNAILDRGTKL